MTTTRRRQHQQFNRLRRIALGLFVLAVLEAAVITILAVNCTSGAAPAPEETAPAPTAETSVPETEAPTAPHRTSRSQSRKPYRRRQKGRDSYTVTTFR